MNVVRETNREMRVREEVGEEVGEIQDPDRGDHGQRKKEREREREREYVCV